MVPMTAKELANQRIGDNHTEKQRNEPGGIIEGKWSSAGCNTVNQIFRRNSTNFQYIQKSENGSDNYIEKNPEKVGDE